MTLPRSAADVLASHVVFELECIDRVYCSLYVPELQRDLGVVGFIREHLGKPVASTAVLAERTEAFYAGIRKFAARGGIPVVDFEPGQRKDDAMRERLARFLAEGRAEGVVFIGRAQEKAGAWATARRRDAEGKSCPWRPGPGSGSRRWAPGSPPSTIRPRSRRSAIHSTRMPSGTWPPSGPGCCRARAPRGAARPATGTRSRRCRRSSP